MTKLKTFVHAAETYRNSTRPGIYESVRTMLKFYGLQSAANIFFNGEAEIAKLVGSNSGDAPRTDIYTDGTFRNKVFVVADIEKHEFNSSYGNAHRGYTERTVWWDEKLELMINPVFVGRKINVEILAHFNNRQEAQAFVNKIDYNRGNQAVDFYFDATVHHPINNGIMSFLGHIYELLQANGGVDKPFAEWFAKHQCAPFTTISNVAGKNESVVVPRKMMNIGITLAEPEIKLAQKADSYGKYEVSLPYYFYWQEFMGWELLYPLEVYQTQIDDIYIPKTKKQYSSEFPKHAAPEYTFGNQIGFPNRAMQSPYFYNLPEHDQWRAPRMDFMGTIIQARLSVEDKDEQILCNIFDLPYEWNPLVKKFVIARRDKAFLRHFTPYVFSVYADDFRVLPTQLRMDEEGNIILTRKPTMWRTYHLVISLDYGIRDWTDDWWDWNHDHPEFWPIVPPIFPWWPWTPDWPNHLPDIIPGLDFGWGDWSFDFSRYEMVLSLWAHNAKDLNIPFNKRGYY